MTSLTLPDAPQEQDLDTFLKEAHGPVIVKLMVKRNQGTLLMLSSEASMCILEGRLVFFLYLLTLNWAFNCGCLWLKSGAEKVWEDVGRHAGVGVLAAEASLFCS